MLRSFTTTCRTLQSTSCTLSSWTRHRMVCQKDLHLRTNLETAGMSSSYTARTKLNGSRCCTAVGKIRSSAPSRRGYSSSFSFMGVGRASSSIRRGNAIARATIAIASESIIFSRRFVRTFATVKSVKIDKGTGRRAFTYWLVLVIKLVRIPVLLMGVYAIGYNEAIIDYSRNPSAMRQDICEKLLKGMGAVDSSQVQVMGEASLVETKKEAGSVIVDGSDTSGYGPSADRAVQLRNLAGVGRRIVNSAKAHVAGELKNQVKAQNYQNDYDDFEEYAYWKMAHERLGMESGIQWSFVLVDVDTPKVLISEYLPNTIFITRGLLDSFISNEHELGLVLAHAISCLIHGNEATKNSTRNMLDILEILILAVDPTEGLLSVSVMAAVAFIKNHLLASYNLEGERRADHLGIKLTAMACFDTPRSTRVMQKLHDAATKENQPQSRPGIFQTKGIHTGNTILSTEQQFLDRYTYLHSMSEEENATKYTWTNCRHLKKEFLKAWAMSKGKILMGKTGKHSHL